MKRDIIVSRTIAAYRRALGATIRNAMEDPNVVEVMLNPDGKIWVDRLVGGRIDTGETMDQDAPSKSSIWLLTTSGRPASDGTGRCCRRICRRRASGFRRSCRRYRRRPFSPSARSHRSYSRWPTTCRTAS